MKIHWKGSVINISVVIHKHCGAVACESLFSMGRATVVVVMGVI